MRSPDHGFAVRSRLGGGQRPSAADLASGSTSICRRTATICSALCFFRAMPQLPCISFSNIFPGTKFAGRVKLVASFHDEVWTKCGCMVFQQSLIGERLVLAVCTVVLCPSTRGFRIEWEWIARSPSFWYVERGRAKGICA